MYNDFENTQKHTHAHGANEINQHVREMEKKVMLSNLQNLTGSSVNPGGLQKIARRIGTLLSTLFLG
jgi:hypothetical protein